MIDGWVITLFAIGSFSISLGLLVAVRDWQKPVNKSFALLSGSVAMWIFGIASFMAAQSHEVALLSAKVFYIAPILLVGFLYYFSLLFPDAKKISNIQITFPIILAIPFIIGILFIPNFMVHAIVAEEWGRQVTVNQWSYIPYALIIFAMFILSFREIYRKTNTLTGVYREQARLFLVSGLFSAIMGAWFDIVQAHWLHDFRYVWVGPLATSLYIAACGLSIVRHKMFDIRSAAVRTLAYILSLIALSLTYFGLAYIASTTIFHDGAATGISMSPINIGLALMLAFLFQPIRHFFDKFTDRIFYRNQYDSNEFVSKLGMVLTSSLDLPTLLKGSAALIEQMFKASSAAFVVYDSKGKAALVGTKEMNRLERDNDKLVELANELDTGMTVLLESVESNPRFRTYASHLQKNSAIAILPLGKDIGLLVLGERKSGQYSRRDFETLNAVANELVIAIQNARSVSEVREFNVSLQQKINDATNELRTSNKKLLELDKTKDEFISMASHQLRTPLTSVKGYVSMVLEGDAGKITPMQRKLLEEAYTSSERMVHLIADFLNVSRIQTGKFVLERHATDLSEVIQQEVESIRQIAQAHGVTLTYRKPRVFPTMYLDDGKLRQVIMNFIDNAIYYSPDSTSIVVKASVEDGSAVVRVIDKGMGVPAAAQKQLFTKFFRADNARTQRPDGTGVGLFLAKKVIVDHGGTIVFESVEGKGSTFGFRLPIKQLSEPPTPTSAQ